MKVSIFIATSGRFDLLLNMVASLNDTIRNISAYVEGVEEVYVVDDDEQSRDYLEWANKDVVDYSPVRRGALNAWNRGLQLCTGDILVPAGDDQLFHGNWLDYALEAHREKLGGYGVVGMNDLAYDGNTQVSTMFLFDRKYCKEQMGGIFAPPVYKYFCVDSEWNAKAKELSRFYWEERSIVEHLHSAHGKRPVDVTDGFKETGWMEIDNKTFEDRKTRCFPVEWEPLI